MNYISVQLKKFKTSAMFRWDDGDINPKLHQAVSITVERVTVDGQPRLAVRVQCDDGLTRGQVLGKFSEYEEEEVSQ